MRQAPSSSNLRKVHMHLTNYSLNKKADGFVHTEEPDGGGDGSKRTATCALRPGKGAGGGGRALGAEPAP